MQSAPNQLFVYGSLLSVIGHAMGDRLRAEADLVGTATLPGARLYRVAWYPGLVETGNPADTVNGELYRLRDPASALPWLDEYEGIAAAPTPADEYARVARAVTAANGAAHVAFVYIYRRAVVPSGWIADGHWRG